MFNNHYDGEATTWSPQGRLFQVEYAMKAVAQGSACLGLKSETHVVLAAVMRSPSELAGVQKKVFKVDEHLGIAIAGLTADARFLNRFMRNETLNHRFVFDSAMPVGRLVNKIADKSQVHTQQYGGRPYGVGLLVAGYDSTGAHLFETCPSGNFYDYKAQAIGARCQSAKTYLEKHVDDFGSADVDALVRHALFALRETLGTRAADEDGLSPQNVAISVVGKDTPFYQLSEDRLTELLDDMEGDGEDADGA